MARSTETDDKLYKIGEVCRMADVQPYVLRYWETEFPQLSPGKSGGGQRLYNRREIDTILRIKELLYRDGFTIAGAKKRLDQDLTDPAPAAPATEEPEAGPPRKALEKALVEAKRDLTAILRMLEE